MGSGSIYYIAGWAVAVLFSELFLLFQGIFVFDKIYLIANFFHSYFLSYGLILNLLYFQIDQIIHKKFKKKLNFIIHTINLLLIISFFAYVTGVTRPLLALDHEWFINLIFLYLWCFTGYLFALQLKEKLNSKDFSKSIIFKNIFSGLIILVSVFLVSHISLPVSFFQSVTILTGSKLHFAQNLLIHVFNELLPIIVIFNFFLYYYGDNFRDSRGYWTVFPAILFLFPLRVAAGLFDYSFFNLIYNYFFFFGSLLYFLTLFIGFFSLMHVLNKERQNNFIEHIFLFIMFFFIIFLVQSLFNLFPVLGHFFAFTNLEFVRNEILFWGILLPLSVIMISYYKFSDLVPVFTKYRQLYYSANLFLIFIILAGWLVSVLEATFSIQLDANGYLSYPGWNFFSGMDRIYLRTILILIIPVITMYIGIFIHIFKPDISSKK